MFVSASPERPPLAQGVTLTVSFTCALSASATQGGAQPNPNSHQPRQGKQVHTGGRPARKNRRPCTAAGQAMPAGASREGLSRTTRDKAHVAPPARGGYDAAWSLIERAHGEKREPTPGFCLCGRTEAARRVPRGRSEPVPGTGFNRPLAARAGAARGASSRSRAPAAVTAKRAWWWH